MQRQKSHLSFKSLYNFLQHFSGIFSKDNALRREQAIQQSCDDLRQRGASEAQVVIFEDILQDMAEAIRGWPQYTSANDKKIATAILAFNFVLLPLIYSWAKPFTASQVVALVAVITTIVFNVCYLGMRLTQERLHIEATGCLLTLVEQILTIGTIIVVIAMLWYIFPSAVLVFLIVSIVAFLIWWLYMFRGAIIAAHIRRVPPPQDNVQSSVTSSPPTN